MGLLHYFLHNHLRGAQPIDANSKEITEVHGNLIRSKALLKKFYEEQYDFFLSELKNIPAGILLELGSGGGFLKERLPSVVTSDVVPLNSVDRVMCATQLNFLNESLSAILMLNVFHHISDVNLFLAEANRCLLPGGKIVMVEPANSLWSRLIFRNFHHEDFDPCKESWDISGDGRMSGANGALPWIVFCRDLERFNEKFPELCVSSCYNVSPFLYLLSGGVSVRQLCPGSAYPLVHKLETFLSPFARFIGLFMRIVVTKRT